MQCLECGVQTSRYDTNLVVDGKGGKDWAKEAWNRRAEDWASILGINRYTLYDRIEKRGWSVERALETPVSCPNCGVSMKEGDGNG